METEIKNDDVDSSQESHVEKKEKSDTKLLVVNKEVVVPGQVLAEGMDYLPSHGTYRQKNKIIANRLGLVTLEGKVIKTIPMNGRYLPKKYDVIIGRVIDILMSGWRLDINSAYSAVLNVKEAGNMRYGSKSDLTKVYRLGDFIFCKITNVTSQNLVDVSSQGQGFRRLYGGRVIYVGTHKVPRIIGKKGSMVNMIKQATGCKVVVGQNGVVWIQSEDPKAEILTVRTIKIIEQESHISGLTDRVKSFLEKETGKSLEIATDEHEHEHEDEGRGN